MSKANALIAGGYAVAYLCQVVDNELVSVRGTGLSAECETVADAIHHLSTGQRVIVAGADMAALRTALGAVSADDGPASLNEVVNEHYPQDWM
jgi:hypothetical protein